MRRLLIELGMALQVLLLVACNKWLDVKPSSQMEREDMYETAEGFKTALTGCYIGMKNSMLYGQALTMTTVEYLAQHWTTKAEDLENFMNFDWEADYSKGQVSSIWSNMYTVINQVNDLLGQMEAKGERVLPEKELRNLIHGEALALRAFCHFDLLRLFGPSPVATDKNATSLPYSAESGKEFRTYYDYDDYCAKIWEDLKAAEKLLAEVDPVLVATYEELNEPKKMKDMRVIIDDFQSYRRVRFNYWALKAFEARVALYMGDKPSAYAYAMEVINARVKEKRVGDISLFNTDMTHEYYTLPSETLFALNVYDLDKKIESLFRSTRTCLYKWGSQVEVLSELFDGQSSDGRYNLWVNMDYEDQKQMSLKKYWQWEDEEDDEAIVYTQQIPMLRMAEMYLITIETASTLTEKNEKLDQLRKSRGLTAKICNTEAEVAEELLREYQREFYAEGQMFFYYKRIGAKAMRWKDDFEIELKDYQAPIPDTEYTL